MSSYTDKARAIYAGGCNCAQAALAPFCAQAGLPEETALLLASSFGGGMGNLREMCGALTGSFMALGLLRGFGRGCTPEEKEAHGVRVQGLAQAFREEFGWVNCRDLLLRNQVDGSHTQERPCMKYVVAAVANLEKALAGD